MNTDTYSIPIDTRQVFYRYIPQFLQKHAPIWGLALPHIGLALQIIRLSSQSGFVIDVA